MNIFDLYQTKITKLVKSANQNKLIENIDNIEKTNVDLPPKHFDCDISTNVAMILAKNNNTSPIKISEILITLFKKDFSEIQDISFAKPGFINIKFKLSFWNNFLKELINDKNFGKNNNIINKSYLLEFVSANPTGPLHVGHCRGAILGDVLANLLLFNDHTVNKEYYVNDYGNQILYFTKSVYYRIREKLYNEPFPKDNKDLYPGDYLINIASNIINKNNNLNFDNFNEISTELTKLSVQESLNLIKLNLNNLGISHDKFISETDLVKNQ